MYCIDSSRVSLKRDLPSLEKMKMQMVSLTRKLDDEVSAKDQVIGETQRLERKLQELSTGATQDRKGWSMWYWMVFLKDFEGFSMVFDGFWRVYHGFPLVFDQFSRVFSRKHGEGSSAKTLALLQKLDT